MNVARLTFKGSLLPCGRRDDTGGQLLVLKIIICIFVLHPINYINLRDPARGGGNLICNFCKDKRGGFFFGNSLSSSMNDFDHKTLDSGTEHIAASLRQARAEQKLRLKEAVKQTGIRALYLEALEQGDWEKLPAGVYGRNFLKEYAIWLKLDPRPLLQLFDRESASTNADVDKVFVERARHTQFFLAIPKLVKILAVIATVALCALYLIFYLNNLTKPPFLELSQPAQDMTVSNTSLEVIGQSETEAEISINGETVLGDENGRFRLQVYLKKGLNTLTVVSKKKYSKPTVINRKILVEY